MITRQRLVYQYVPEMTETTAAPHASPRSQAGGESRRRPRNVAPALPPRRAGGRPGGRSRARARPDDDLPLVRLARGADRRDGGASRGTALRGRARRREGRRRRCAPGHVRSHQPRARSRARTAELPRARTGRAAHPDVEWRHRPSAGGGHDRGLHRGGGAQPAPTGLRSTPPRSPTRSSASPRRSSSTTRQPRCVVTSTASASSRRRSSACRS